MSKYLILSFSIILLSCDSKPKVFGCIDENALNYDSAATVMKDSSCIVLDLKRVTYNKRKTKVIIDTLKYSNYDYAFIYPIQKSDTIIKIKKYSFQRFLGFSYYQYSLVESDTVIISSSSFRYNRDVYVDNDVKVIETIKGFKPKTYFINIHDEGTNLINPRSRFRYKTETAVYEKFPSFLGGPSNTIERYQGFYINITSKINYWFEEHPSTITVYDDEYSLKKYYRTNITRY